MGQKPPGLGGGWGEQAAARDLSWPHGDTMRQKEYLPFAKVLESTKPFVYRSPHLVPMTMKERQRPYLHLKVNDFEAQMPGRPASH